MSEEEPETAEIDVVQEEADHYQVYPATGAVGGVQIRGNVELDFVLDRNVPAHTETFALEDGSLGEVVGTQGRQHISREKQVGVSMSQSNAFDLATWLIADLFVGDTTQQDVTEALTEAFPENFE